MYRPINGYLICKKLKQKRQNVSEGGIALPDNMADPDKPGVERYRVVASGTSINVGETVIASAYSEIVVKRGVYAIKRDDVIAVETEKAA